MFFLRFGDFVLLFLLIFFAFPPFDKVFASLTAGLSSAALLCRLSLYVRELVCVVNRGAFSLKVEKNKRPTSL